ncbi:MAG: DNA repair protein RecN [Atopobiaceae bacterium]|jgi:DNA repair protein RecN (Recombination protein N)
MLDEMHVRNVALIQDATLRLNPGLTVLTGETGAGKSALLSAIKLMMGERADTSAIREGTDGLAVEGRFYISGDTDPDGVVVSRKISAQGHGRVSINGQMASVRELAESVGATIDLCGQHEHQKLLEPQTHVKLLDLWGKEPAAHAHTAYKDALHAARAAAQELARVQEICRSAAQKLDQAAFVVRQIDEVSPKEDELEELEATLPKAEHAEMLVHAALGSHEELTGDEGVVDRISAVLSELQDASRHDQDLLPYVQQIEGALIELEDAASGLRDYADSVEFEPDALNHMQERMAQLQRLLRNYGPKISDVLEKRAQAQEVVNAANNGDKLLAEAQHKLDKAEAALAQRADELDEIRALAAPELARKISDQMAYLEMGTAQLSFDMERLDRAQWTDEGPSKVELMYQPGAGLRPRPLKKIASGGEISRVMLACKVVLGDQDETETLVFDEVDAGVGGSTAVALAKVLSNLARTHQVIVVTHLAQVAVMGQTHYVVSKTDGDIPETHLTEISGSERVSEIARMLSGDASKTALEHAQELLDAARGEADSNTACE